jgi:hypothetical protein
MLRSRGTSEVLLPGLLFTLLLMTPSCTGEEATTEDPPIDDAPASAVTLQLPETEAGGVLAAALADAGITDRHVFVHTGADW